MIEKMPFGTTGHLSTRIIFGAAALSDVPQAEADRSMEVLAQYGINHIDVAASYHDAELRIGPWMPAHRDEFFLASKTNERSAVGARQQIENSLRRLQTDHLDLIQFHCVTTPEELEQIFGPQGALEAAEAARAAGKVRFIGITSHSLTAPAMLVAALERYPFASTLLPYNFPMLQNPQYAAGFERLAQVCAERQVALQTIKSLCRRPWAEGAPQTASTWYEPLTDDAAIRKAVGFVLGRPGIFLNSTGETQLLPQILAAADRGAPRPSDAEMQALVIEQEMAPLWPEVEPAA